MKIKIKDKEYEYSFDSIWGVIYDFETLTQGKVTYDGKIMLHNHIAIYGILLRKNEDFTMEFEEFVSALNDMKLANQLVSYFTKRMQLLSEVSIAPEGEEPKKKRID